MPQMVSDAEVSARWLVEVRIGFDLSSEIWLNLSEVTASRTQDPTLDHTSSLGLGMDLPRCFMVAWSEAIKMEWWVPLLL
jgi:hypothetical protein